jgi:protein involved in temperature-dependent protein secretion|tara:strand:+ start:198 stop:401 length:204 start_codon:yes stop_codon:yes gene_type:complete
MPAKEIKELRKSGKLREALTMAQDELQADPTNIWAKRNISWVYYDELKIWEQFQTILKRKKLIFNGL